MLSRVTNDVDTIGQTMNPVSYTHLDVYKRQVVSRDSALLVGGPC